MTPDEPEDSGVRVRIRGRELSFAMTEQQADRARELARTVLHEPFTKRVWSELAFFLLSAALAGVGLAFVSFTMVAGLFLAITFFGLAVLALSLRSARGIGGLQRGLARNMLDEAVEDPQPFAGRPGLPGLAAVLPARPRGLARRGLPRPQGALVDPRRPGGRQPVVGRLRLPHSTRSSAATEADRRYGVSRQSLLPGGRLRIRPDRASSHNVGILVAGLVFLIVRRALGHARLRLRRPPFMLPARARALAARLRRLEQPRTPTVDASAASFDGSSGTCATAPRRSWSRCNAVGLAKEKWKTTGEGRTGSCSRTVDGAPRRPGGRRQTARHGRGIHPPALDIGLEGALARLAAAERGAGRARRLPAQTALTGDRGDCLLFRGRAACQRRPARPGIRASVSCRSRYVASSRRP